MSEKRLLRDREIFALTRSKYPGIDPEIDLDFEVLHLNLQAQDARSFEAGKMEGKREVIVRFKGCWCSEMAQGSAVFSCRLDDWETMLRELGMEE